MNKYTTAWTETRWEKPRGRNAKHTLPVTARTIRELGSRQIRDFTELESRCAEAAMIERASLNDMGKLKNREHEPMGKIGNKSGG